MSTEETEPIRQSEASPLHIARLIGPGTDIESLGVREFKHVSPSESGSSAGQLREQIHQFTHPELTNVAHEIGQTITYKDDIYSHYAYELYDGLQKKLIDPKVKTGKIAELAIRSIQSDEVPGPLMTKFRSFHNRERVQDEYIEGYDSYYQIFGKLKVGSALSAIACGVCVAPYREMQKVGFNSYHPSSFIHFKSLVEKYKQGNTASDVKAWDGLIQQSILREGAARNNPLRGGLMRPR